MSVCVCVLVTEVGIGSQSQKRKRSNQNSVWLSSHIRVTLPETSWCTAVISEDSVYRHILRAAYKQDEATTQQSRT